MSKYQDGWHKIAGYTIHVENGRVSRGVEHRAGSVIWRPTFPYRWNDKLRCWCNESMTVDAFRAGVRRGTIAMK